MPLDAEEIAELTKLQKMVNQLQKIEKGAVNELQKIRVAYDIERYRRKMQEISPEGLPDNIAQQLFNANQKKAGKGEDKMRVISQFPVMKISPHSNDSEINQIGTLMNAIDLEYIPILGEGHIKFDYSHNTEKDGVLKYMENLRRNMKILIETIEEYAGTEKPEFREQLARMKNKQSRIFIAEAGETLSKFQEFLAAVNAEINEGNNVILNMDEPIKFNPRYEKATLLEGKSILEALREFHQFVNETLEVIKLPSFRG